MILACPPDETSPFVRAFLADRGIAWGSLELAIDARDEMLSFLLQSLEGDRDRALFAYFRSGLSVADTLLQVLRWRFGDLSRAGSLFDFASGYGRITRFLVREIPPERVRVADVYAEAVRFQEERFGVRGTVSTVRPEDFACLERFDAVLVTSLFTHLPEERFVDWLRVLLGRLNPGGVLLFSTHHPDLLPSPPPADRAGSGLHFQEISESGSLDTRDYGSTWVTEEFVRRAAARACGDGAPLPSVHRLERALCSYQDLYVLLPEPDAGLSGLELAAEPELFVDLCETAGPDRLEMHGWAAARRGRAEAVEVLLDGVPLAVFPVDRPRPDVARLLGGERFLLSGWGGTCPLPPGLSRGDAVLLLRVRDASGRSHLLRADTVESLLLGSARNRALALSAEARQAAERLRQAEAEAAAEIAGLRSRIAAMEASRFWKLRRAWFRLKRTLGLTEEE